MRKEGRGRRDGRGTHALQSNSSSGPLLHNGVVMLPQWEQIGPSCPSPASSFVSLRCPFPGNCVECGFRFFFPPGRGFPSASTPSAPVGAAAPGKAGRAAAEAAAAFAFFPPPPPFSAFLFPFAAAPFPVAGAGAVSGGGTCPAAAIFALSTSLAACSANVPPPFSLTP
jgi:hypothetical protein